MKLLRKTTMLLLTFVFSVVLLGSTKLTALADTTITPIKTNTDVVGTIPEERGTSLYYSFKTSKTGYFIISLSHTDISQNGRFEFELMDNNRESLETKWTKGGLSISSDVWPCVPNVTYYVRVGDYNGSSGQKFKLNIKEVAEANWERENNNKQETATPIAVNTGIKGVLCNNDEDWYKVKLGAAGYFQATLKHRDIAENGKYKMEVFDDKGTLIIDGTGKTIELNSKGFNVGSTIYVKITNEYDAKWQPYELNVKFTKSDVYESEWNNTQAAADPVSMGKKYYGMMGEKNDPEDWFVFNNPKNGVVTLTFGPNDVAKKGKWSVKVVDAKGNEKSVYRDTVIKSIPMFLQKGKYYLKIEDDYDSRGCLYTFSLARKDYAVTGATKIKKAKYVRGLFRYAIVKQVKLSKKAKNATDYEIKISKSKKMKKPVVKEVVKAGKTLELSNGINKGKYYVQVRPCVTDLFGGHWYGKKSNVYTLKVK